MIALLRQPNVVPSLFSQGVDVGEPVTPRSRLSQRSRALAWGRLRPQGRGGEALDRDGRACRRSQREHSAVREPGPTFRHLALTRLCRACLQLTL